MRLLRRWDRLPRWGSEGAGLGGKLVEGQVWAPRRSLSMVRHLLSGDLLGTYIATMLEHSFPPHDLDRRATGSQKIANKGIKKCMKAGESGRACEREILRIEDHPAAGILSVASSNDTQKRLTALVSHAKRSGGGRRWIAGSFWSCTGLVFREEISCRFKKAAGRQKSGGNQRHMHIGPSLFLNLRQALPIGTVDPCTACSSIRG